MSFTRAGFPSCYASEGKPGEFGFGDDDDDWDPYFHTDRDVVDVDDEKGTFSFDVRRYTFPCLCSPANLLQHMARFAEFAIAFVIEQAGWNNKWR